MPRLHVDFPPTFVCNGIAYFYVFMPSQYLFVMIRVLNSFLLICILILCSLLCFNGMLFCQRKEFLRLISLPLRLAQESSRWFYIIFLTANDYIWSPFTDIRPVAFPYEKSSRMTWFALEGLVLRKKWIWHSEKKMYLAFCFNLVCLINNGINKVASSRRKKWNRLNGEIKSVWEKWDFNLLKLWGP